MSDNFAFRQLLELCRRTHEEMQSRASRTVDLALVVRNWLFGWYIVEFEQHGADRAEYGAQLIKRLALDLRIKGTSATNLRKFRQFYREFPIQQALSVESGMEMPKEANIFASRYQLYLPSKEELKAQLVKIEAELSGERNE
jgi:DUF1016 N-terminal domain